MTLRERVNKYMKYYNYGVVILLLLVALFGLILFSMKGITENHFENIYFLIQTAITLAGFTLLSGIFEGKETNKGTAPISTYMYAK